MRDNGLSRGSKQGGPSLCPGRAGESEGRSRSRCWAPKACRRSYGRKHRASLLGRGGFEASNQHPEEKKSDAALCGPQVFWGVAGGGGKSLAATLTQKVSILRLLRKGIGAFPLVLQLELRSKALRQALPSPNSLMICLLVQIREPASGEM